MNDAAADLRDWIGRSATQQDDVSLFPARGMTALLDRDPDSIEPGSLLPSGWHWLYFKPLAKPSMLGPDGHPRRGSFMPPVPLPRRMWAGGRLQFHTPLRIGDRVERVSTVDDVSTKQGRSGSLVFVTVRHRVSGPAGLAIDEEQDIVYREAPNPGAAGRSGASVRETPCAWAEDFVPDRVRLFQFSALTYNSHRIHWDEPYAIEEGYPGLVVHGPLLALLLMQAVERRTPEGRLAAFDYRAISPLFVGEPVRLCGESPEGNPARLWATGAADRMAMEATASW